MNTNLIMFFIGLLLFNFLFFGWMLIRSRNKIKKVEKCISRIETGTKEILEVLDDQEKVVRRFKSMINFMEDDSHVFTN